MAEQLGQAVLEITVDDKQLRDGLNRARNTIERAGGEFKLNLGGSDQQLQRLAATAKTLETQLKKLQSTPLNLGTRDLAKLGGDFSKAGTEISAFTRSVINGDSALANSTAGLRQQALAFRTLAANVKFTSTEFKNFTQAAAKASQKELFAGFQQINAQESLFKLGGFGGNDTFKGTEQLLEFSKKVGTTPAAINLYITALEQALSVTSTTDANFAKLTAEIQKQANALTTAAAAADRYISSLSKQAPALPPAKGPAPFTLDAPTPEEAAAEERRKRREQKIADRIDYISTGGRDQSVVPPSFAARPDPENIKAEERLAESRRRTRAETIKAAEAENRAREKFRKQEREALGNALIGGAFPALFGQGIGASIGGAVGGGVGGLLGGNFGFGLSLVGTALGQRFDDINKALENPIANFEQLKTSGALSSKSLEKYAEGLIATGRTAEAAALIQQDLTNSFGADSLAAFANIRSASDELNRSFGQAAGAVGAFIAGPLASFLRQLASAGNNFSTATRFESLVGRLNPDQYRQVRGVTDRATREAQRRNGGLPFLPPSEGEVAEGRQAGIAEAQRLLGIKEEELALERAIAQARLQTTKELSNSYRLISAQVQGNRTAQLDERANAAIDERNRALRELAAQNITAQDDPRVVEANQTAAKELFRIEEERLQLQKEIARTIEQEAIKRNQIAQSIQVARAQRDAALAAADSAANPGNSTLAARAGQLDSLSFLAQNRLQVEQAITRERQLQAQLAQESDPTKRSQLAEQLSTAADEIQLAGEQAGAALAKQAANAAKSLRSAEDTLRGTLQSNFKFLPRDQRRSLLDSARDDIERGRRSGILRPNFGAAGSSRIFEAADFVRNVEQQRAQVAQLQAAQQPLVDALTANTNAERNIRINITMNADGTATANQTEQQAALL